MILLKNLSKPGLILFLFFSVFISRAQNNDEINSVHGNYQLDAQYYQPDSLIGAPKVPEKLLSNAFGNVNYTKGNFSAGIRYEAYNNVKQGFLPQYKGQGITNRFFRYRTQLLDVTVGNFYEQFGSGIMLRTYYEPGLLYDNSIDGVRAISNPIKGLTLKGVIGKQRYFFTTGPGIVRGIDGEVNINELFDTVLGKKKMKVILGGSFVSKFQADQDPDLVLPQNVGCYGGRLNIIREGFSLFAEYAYKINDPSADNKLSYKFGDAAFLSTSYAGDGWSFLVQGKRIDNMSFRTDRNESLQNLLINYLPATTKQHSYTLLALNPYATQLRGEIGGLAEFQYKFKKGTPLGGKYGMEITINGSQANGLKQIPVGDSITNRTYYKTSYTDIGKLYYNDFFVEINKKFSKKWKGTFVYANQFYNRNIIQFATDLAVYKNLQTTIGVIDITYKYKSGSSIRFETQGLFTPDNNVETNSNLIAKGNWATALVEWSPSGHFFMAVFDQYNYGNPNPALQIHYYLFNMGYNNGPHRITVGYGKQSAGIFCVGGVCRVVPASNGLTLSITSSF